MLVVGEGFIIRGDQTGDFRFSSTGKNYITAGDDAQSYVYDKITGSQGMGSMMPHGGPPLTNEQIQVVSEWILGGANP